MLRKKMKIKIYILTILLLILVLVAFSTRIVNSVNVEDGIVKNIEYENSKSNEKSLAMDSQKWIKLNYHAAEETLSYNFNTLERAIKTKLDELEKKSELFRTVKKIVLMSIESSKRSIKNSIANAIDNNDEKKSASTENIYT
jgi:hypothetical protein